jgi:hypothetical protein
MADEQTANTENQSTLDATKNTDTTDDKQPVPYDRFQKAIADKNALKAQLDAINKAQKDAEAAQAAKLIEDGKIQQAYDQLSKRAADLEAKAAKADEQEKWFAETLKQRLEKQPPHIKTLLEKLPVLDALGWLEANAETLAKNSGSRSNLDGTAKGADMAVASLTSEEIAAAQRFGQTLEQYAAYKNKGAISRNAPKDK